MIKPCDKGAGERCHKEVDHSFIEEAIQNTTSIVQKGHYNKTTTK